MRQVQAPNCWVSMAPGFIATRLSIGHTLGGGLKCNTGKLVRTKPVYTCDLYHLWANSRAGYETISYKVFENSVVTCMCIILVLSVRFWKRRARSQALLKRDHLLRNVGQAQQHYCFQIEILATAICIGWCQNDHKSTWSLWGIRS